MATPMLTITKAETQISSPFLDGELAPKCSICKYLEQKTYFIIRECFPLIVLVSHPRYSMFYFILFYLFIFFFRIRKKVHTSLVSLKDNFEDAFINETRTDALYPCLDQSELSKIKTKINIIISFVEVCINRFGQDYVLMNV